MLRLRNKMTPLVFYCGGVTCPLSPKAMKIAKANGYKNVRAYVEGFPACGTPPEVLDYHKLDGASLSNRILEDRN